MGKADSIWSRSQYVTRSGRFVVIYSGVQFDFAKAQRFGIRLVSNGEHAPISRRPAQNQCEERLAEIMSGAPITMTKADFRKKMQGIPGLSARAFDRAWAEIAPKFGRDKSGAKPKGNNRSG
jgi:hypothetical protein